MLVFLCVFFLLCYSGTVFIFKTTITLESKQKVCSHLKLLHFFETLAFPKFDQSCSLPWLFVFLLCFWENFTGVKFWRGKPFSRMPVKRTPPKPRGGGTLPNVQITGASDVDEAGSIVSNIGRDFERLEDKVS